MNFHLALVGLGHVHPQLPAAGLAGTIETGHIVAVVVLLSLSKTEPTGGMRNQDAKNHRVWIQEFMALPGGQTVAQSWFRPGSPLAPESSVPAP